MTISVMCQLLLRSILTAPPTAPTGTWAGECPRPLIAGAEALSGVARAPAARQGVGDLGRLDVLRLDGNAGLRRLSYGLGLCRWFGRGRERIARKGRRAQSRLPVTR